MLREFEADEDFPRWGVRHVEQVYGKCGKFIDPKLEKNKVDLFCWLGLYIVGVISTRVTKNIFFREAFFMHFYK